MKQSAFSKMIDTATSSPDGLDAFYDGLMSHDHGDSSRDAVHNTGVVFDPDDDEHVQFVASPSGLRGGHKSGGSEDNDSDMVFDMDDDERLWDATPSSVPRGRSRSRNRLYHQYERGNHGLHEAYHERVPTSLAQTVHPEIERRNTSSSSFNAVAAPMAASAPPITTFVHAYTVGSPTHIMESLSPHGGVAGRRQRRPTLAGSMASSSSRAITYHSIPLSGLPRIPAMMAMASPTSPHPIPRMVSSPSRPISSVTGTTYSRPLLSADSPLLASPLAGEITNDEDHDADDSDNGGPSHSAAHFTQTYHPHQHRNDRHPRSSATPLHESGSASSGSSGPIPIPIPATPPRRQHYVPGQLHPHHPQHSRFFQGGQDRARQSPASVTTGPSSQHSRPTAGISGQTPRQQSSLPQFSSRHTQPSWPTNMVLSTTETAGIDPSAWINSQPCDSAISSFSLDPAVPLTVCTESAAKEASSPTHSSASQTSLKSQLSIDTTATSTLATVDIANPAIQDCEDGHHRHEEHDGPLPGPIHVEPPSSSPQPKGGISEPGSRNDVELETHLLHCHPLRQSFLHEAETLMAHRSMDAAVRQQQLWQGQQAAATPVSFCPTSQHDQTEGQLHTADEAENASGAQTSFDSFLTRQSTEIHCAREHIRSHYLEQQARQREFGQQVRQRWLRREEEVRRERERHERELHEHDHFERERVEQQRLVDELSQRREHPALEEALGDVQLDARQRESYRLYAWFLNLRARIEQAERDEADALAQDDEGDDESRLELHEEADDHEEDEYDDDHEGEEDDGNDEEADGDENESFEDTDEDDEDEDEYFEGDDGDDNKQQRTHSAQSQEPLPPVPPLPSLPLDFPRPPARAPQTAQASRSPAPRLPPGLPAPASRPFFSSPPLPAASSPSSFSPSTAFVPSALVAPFVPASALSHGGSGSGQDTQTEAVAGPGSVTGPGEGSSTGAAQREQRLSPLVVNGSKEPYLYGSEDEHNNINATPNTPEAFGDHHGDPYDHNHHDTEQPPHSYPTPGYPPSHSSFQGESHTGQPAFAHHYRAALYANTGYVQSYMRHSDHLEHRQHHGYGQTPEYVEAHHHSHPRCYQPYALPNAFRPGQRPHGDDHGQGQQEHALGRSDNSIQGGNNHGHARGLGRAIASHATLAQHFHPYRLRAPTSPLRQFGNANPTARSVVHRQLYQLQLQQHQHQQYQQQPPFPMFGPESFTASSPTLQSQTPSRATTQRPLSALRVDSRQQQPNARGRSAEGRASPGHEMQEAPPQTSHSAHPRDPRGRHAARAQRPRSAPDRSHNTRVAEPDAYDPQAPGSPPESAPENLQDKKAPPLAWPQPSLDHSGASTSSSGNTPSSLASVPPTSPTTTVTQTTSSGTVSGASQTTRRGQDTSSSVPGASHLSAGSDGFLFGHTLATTPASASLPASLPVPLSHGRCQVPPARSPQGRRMAALTALAMTPIVSRQRRLQQKKQLPEDVRLRAAWASHPAALAFVRHAASDDLAITVRPAMPLEPGVLDGIDPAIREGVYEVVHEGDDNGPETPTCEPHTSPSFSILDLPPAFWLSMTQHTTCNDPVDFSAFDPAALLSRQAPLSLRHRLAAIACAWCWTRRVRGRSILLVIKGDN